MTLAHLPSDFLWPVFADSQRRLTPASLTPAFYKIVWLRVTFFNTYAEAWLMLPQGLSGQEDPVLVAHLVDQVPGSP
jgi:hypothetical protein